MSVLNRTSVSADQTPILGGDLDGNSKDISNVNNLTVDGNLTVHGTTVTLNTETLDVEDNVITVNNGETGAGVTAGTAGIEVDRGTNPNASFLYTESTDSWDISSKKITNLASPTLANDAATKGYVDASSSGVLVTHSGTGAEINKTTNRNLDHDFRTISGGSNVTVTQNANDISISSTDTNTTYTASTGLNLTGTAFSLDSNIEGLANVSATAPSTGEVLKWNGANWAPAADEDTGENNTASNLGSGAGTFKQKSSDDLQFRSITGGSNVTVTENASDISISATDTDTTYTAGTGLNLTGTSFSLNANVNDLADAVITSAQTDDVLQWNGTQWINAQIEEEGTTASNLGATGASVFAQKTSNDLEFRKLKAGSNISITQNANDVEISSTASGQVLSVNSQTGTVTLDTDDISEGSSHLYYTDTRVDTRIGNTSVNALSDVVITSVADNQFLRYDTASGNWQNETVTFSSYSDSDVDTHLNQSTATTSDVLSWNGSDYAWVAQSGGGSSFTGDLSGNDLTDSTSSNGKVNINQWVNITQSVNNPGSPNDWEPALKVENFNDNPNTGQTNSTVSIWKEINGSYDAAELNLVVADNSTAQNNAEFILGVQGNGSNRLLITSVIKDQNNNNVYQEMGAFNAGITNQFGPSGQGISFNYGLNTTPTSASEYIQSNLTGWTLSWGNAGSGNVFQQLRGYHFNIVGDGGSNVTQLTGPTDWQDLLGDANWPQFGSKQTFEFLYSFGWFNTPATPYAENLWPAWSGQNSYGNWSPGIFWKDGTRPSWLTSGGATQNLSAVNSAHILVKLIFPNGPYDCIVDATYYIQ